MGIPRGEQIRDKLNLNCRIDNSIIAKASISYLLYLVYLASN
jgi:hypothetical protein